MIAEHLLFRSAFKINCLCGITARYLYKRCLRLARAAGIVCVVRAPSRSAGVRGSAPSRSRPRPPRAASAVRAASVAAPAHCEGPGGSACEGV